MFENRLINDKINLIMKKVILIILIVIILTIALVVGVFVLNGNKYYKELIAEKSIETCVNEIRNNKNFTKKEDMTKEYLDAVVAVEDHRYYEHGAIDVFALARAIVVNISNKKYKEGGSTITQQLAKNMYFMDGTKDPEGYFESALQKIAEAFISTELEKKYSKDEILEMYVNIIYFGQSNYGIKEASNYYYDKDPNTLNLDEASLLAGIPNAPSLYNPIDSMEYARSRQKKVLSSMVEYNYITQEQMDQVINNIKDNTTKNIEDTKE